MLFQLLRVSYLITTFLIKILFYDFILDCQVETDQVENEILTFQNSRNKLLSYLSHCGCLPRWEGRLGTGQFTSSGGQQL